MASDDVELPDLQVIQRYSLAVRGATAPRADVVAALQADLAWLTGSGGRRLAAERPGLARGATSEVDPVDGPPAQTPASTAKPAAKTVPPTKAPARKAATAKKAALQKGPAKRPVAAKTAAPARKAAPVKKVAAKKVAKRTRSGGTGARWA